MPTIVESNLLPIVLTPLFGALLAFLIGQRVKSLAGPMATGACVLSALLVYVHFYRLTPETRFEQHLGVWFTLSSGAIGFGFRFDQLSALMCLIITGVGSLIHLYSIGYMETDQHQHRYFSYLNLFIFFMLMLVLGSNLLVTFVGWEGVGLCSYLLIGFWFDNPKYVAAAQKAFVMNRIGDVGFLVAAILCLVSFGSLEYSVIERQLTPGLDYSVLALFLFFAATGKSAQIPLFTWLPDAMAGPTPVSALIHAATMVTAGLYLLARMHALFAASPLALAVMLWVAILTALVAALTAFVQTDIKKVLAYSTVSQLGFMFIAAACSAFDIALFHVLTHAFFKACLFLAAGVVIHGCHHEQDMRRYGGLASAMPFTCAFYLLATLAISGIFPFSGYFSKHAIFDSLSHNDNPYLGISVPYVLLLAKFTAYCTAWYMGRSFALTFLGQRRSEIHAHEGPVVMLFPVGILAGLSLVGGALSVSRYLAPVLPTLNPAHGEGSIFGHLLDSVPALAVLVVAMMVYSSKYGIVYISEVAYRRLRPLAQAAKRQFFFDDAYESAVIIPLKVLARFLDRCIERFGCEGIPRGIPEVANLGASCAQLLQSGNLRHYVSLMGAGTVLLLFLYLNF